MVSEVSFLACQLGNLRVGRNAESVRLQVFAVAHRTFTTESSKTLEAKSIDCAFVDRFIRPHVNRSVTDAGSSIQINGVRHPVLVEPGVYAR